MPKTSLKKGHVKLIKPESLKVVVLGPKNKNGYHFEKELSFHCAEFYDETKEEAFEFLRKNLVGKKIQFDDFKLKGRTAADIFLDKELISFKLASMGLVRAVHIGDKTTKYYADLVEGSKLAQKNMLGIHKEVEKGKKRKQKFWKFEKLLDQKLEGYIDTFNYEMDFQFFCPLVGRVIKNIRFLGIKIPIIGKEHAIKLKNFLSKHGHQRDCIFILKRIEGDEKGWVVDDDITNDESVLRKLLLNGWVRLDNDASVVLSPIEFLGYKQLQDEAMNKKKGIWKNYKGNTDKTISIGARDFEGVIQEVLSGDRFMVKNKTTKEVLKLNLTSIRAPNCNNLSDPSTAAPWALKAREFMRKRYIGKTVQVRLDAIKQFELNDKEITINSVTMKLGDDILGVKLLENGLAEFKTPRTDEVASSGIKNFADAFELGKEKKVGLHSNKKPGVNKYWDMSVAENRKKIKGDIMMQGLENRERGVVEYVFSGSRFKIRSDKNKIFFTLSLNSVKTLSDKNMENHEKWNEKAKLFAKSNLYQRDIEFKIDQIDKKGITHGTIFLNGKNFCIPVLKKGYGYLETYRTNDYINKYRDAENYARENKKGIWGDKVSFGKKESSSKTLESKNVTISELYSMEEIYLQEKSSKLKQIENMIKENRKTLKNLKEPISKGTIALGEYENLLYRVKILQKKKTGYEVIFIDYGNRDVVELTKLKVCPEKIKKINPLSVLSNLDYLIIPKIDQLSGQKSFDYFDNLVGSSVLYAEYTRSSYGIGYCLLYKNKGDKIEDSINFLMLKNGMALLDPNGEKAEDKLWMDAYETGLNKNPDLISILNNQDY